MREIKFRAWSKKHNKFVEILLISYNDGIFALRICVNGKTDENLFSDEVEIMQYTGFKDKTGKEVYDGDIVNVYKFYQTDNIVLENAVVRWDEFRGGWYFECQEDIAKSEDVFHDARIVGNIYENQELVTNYDLLRRE